MVHTESASKALVNVIKPNSNVGLKKGGGKIFIFRKNSFGKDENVKTVHKMLDAIIKPTGTYNIWKEDERKSLESGLVRRMELLKNVL